MAVLTTSVRQSVLPCSCRHEIIARYFGDPKPNVRPVLCLCVCVESYPYNTYLLLHSVAICVITLPKSVEGYYQESGRAISGAQSSRQSKSFL